MSPEDEKNLSSHNEKESKGDEMEQIKQLTQTANLPFISTSINPTDQSMGGAIGELALALSKAQFALRPAKKNAENPFFKSAYADLESVIESVRTPLFENELAFVQQAGGNGELVSVTTTLIHKSGGWIKGTVVMKPTKNDPQGVGSCLSYSRRYCLSALLGISTEDDDGNIASEPKPKESTNRASKAPDTNKPRQTRGHNSDKAVVPDTYWTFNNKKGALTLGVTPGDKYTEQVLTGCGLRAWEGSYFSPHDFTPKQIEEIKKFLAEVKEGEPGSNG